MMNMRGLRAIMVGSVMKGLVRSSLRCMALSLSWGCLATFTAVLSAQTPKLAPVGAIAGPADLVEVHGTYAYVAAGPTLRVVDVKDVSAPRVTGTFTFPYRIWAFALSGSLAYVAGDWSGLTILDVSDPAAPRLRGSFKTLGQAWGVAVSGTQAVVANQMSGIDIVDVSDPDKPVSVGSYFTEGYARDVAASGSLAYVVDQPTGFSILDVSKAGQPTEVSSQQSTQGGLFVAVSESPGSAAAGPKLACVLGGRGLQGGGGPIQIYDVSNPSAPVKLASYKTPGRAFRFNLQGSLAYVADGPGGLQVIDLSNPAEPTIAGSYTTAGPARDVTVAGSHAYVVVGETSQGTDPKTGGTGVLILRLNP
jgi:hypothetical protein